jgi:hypothetical protein
MGRADADPVHLDLFEPDRDPARHYLRARPAIGTRIIRLISVIFIEFWRGVPIIA